MFPTLKIRLHMTLIIAFFQRGRWCSRAALTGVCALFLLSTGGAKADVSSHAQMDALMAEAARLAPMAQAVEMSVGVVSPAQ